MNLRRDWKSFKTLKSNKKQEQNGIAKKGSELVFWFETVSLCVAQAGFELVIPLLTPLQCWDSTYKTECLHLELYNVNEKKSEN